MGCDPTKLGAKFRRQVFVVWSGDKAPFGRVFGILLLWIRGAADNLSAQVAASTAVGSRFPDHFPTNSSGRGANKRDGTVWRGRFLDTKSASGGHRRMRRHGWLRIKSPEL